MIALDLLARAYLDKLRTPIKGFYTFEEPGKVRQIMQQDILAGANRLAEERNP